MRLQIAQASKKDIPVIRNLVFRVWPQTYASILSQEQIVYMLELMYSEQSLQQQFDENIQFIIIRDGNEPIGFAAYQCTAPTQYKLHKLYVLPGEQGKGTGKSLIIYIENIIAKNGGGTCTLQVNRHNNARNFYEKNNYTLKCESVSAIGNGFVMDDYILEKEIERIEL